MPHSLLNQPKVLLEQVINHALDAFVVIDATSTVIAWSRQAETLFGWSAREAVGKSISDLIIPPELRQRHYEGMRRFLETGESHVLGRRIEITAQNRSGAVFPVELAITELEMEGRRVFSAALRDITQRLEIEEQFRVTFEQVAVGIAHFTTDRKVLRVNQKLCNILGYSKEELLALSPDVLSHPEDRNIGSRYLKEVLSGRSESSTYEKRFIRKNGEVIWVQATVSLLRTASGAPKYFIAVIEDITERKHVQERAERLAAVIEETPDFVGFGTVRGEVLYINRAGREMLGLSPGQEVQGLSISTKYPEWAWARVEEGIKVALKEGAWRGESTVVKGDGSQVLVSQAIIAHASPSGKVEYLSTIIRDISELKQREDALREADRRKDEFLAMLAHELRNPLAPISAAAQLLKLGRLDQTRTQQASEIIGRQVQHMTELVDDLLDVSRVTRGLVSINPEPVELSDVINAAIEQTRALIEAKGHELAVQLDSQQVWLQADRTRLVQAIANLLSNAARYTPKAGRIELIIDAQDTEVEISVRDNGEGIAPELLPHVFELFVQGKRSPDRAQGGLGLGLALVKNLVEMHGGRVFARSAGIGKGSEFSIRLPVVKSGGKEREDRKQTLKGEKKPLHVMVVDDNVDAAATLAMLLDSMGYQVLVAHDGIQALELIRERRADVLLLDIGLPGIDGYDLVRRLRQLPHMAGSVFVAVTGYGLPGDLEKARKAGFDYHLLKPVETEKLLGILNSVSSAKRVGHEGELADKR